MSVSASTLYNLVQCPHRVTMDAFGDLTERDPENPFVQLLWERGTAYESEVIGALKIPFHDLSRCQGTEKTKLTLEAMRRREPLIYGGRLEADDLVGIPDLLRREEDGYIPGDIKAGAGKEGGSEDSDGKPKRHYAVQLALYVDALERLGFSAGRRGFIWDIHGDEVIYDLSLAQGPKTPQTLWELYQESLGSARDQLSRTLQSSPAYAGVCKLCHWHTACVADLEARDDLTLMFDLGRGKRDVLAAHFNSMADFAAANPEAYIEKKKTQFPGIGPDVLRKLHRRAQLIAQKGRPFLRDVLKLPTSDVELFFDIEHDPMRDICYLHGIVERRADGSERYVAFVAEAPTPDEEKKAFAAAWQYFQSNEHAVVYYYSNYECRIYNKLRERYPEVCGKQEIDALFAPPRSVDLYTDVVRKATEWPTRDYSLKTLSKYLGFSWRDQNPSGAASIEWYHRWTTTGNAAIRQRILDYNEDDCRAMRVLVDGVRTIS